MDTINVKKEKKTIREQLIGYSGISESSILRYADELLDIIDFLQKENESLKQQTKPIIKEKIVYRKR